VLSVHSILVMSPICLSLKANLVVELVGCHQRPAGCGIGL